jgi:BirA family biotin operon repressor/biotin-[acetyl-CoA-carboxylase] ligase
MLVMKRLSLCNPFNAPVYHEETVGSTMDLARALAARGDPHGAVITADFQEAGRGRIRGRQWDMDRGKSLPFTILLRYPRIEDIPTALTLRTGLAVALAVEDFAPSLSGAVAIKWPNDVMIRFPPGESAGRAKKIAGILTEADGGVVFIGIGINVAQREFPPELRDKAVSIALAAGKADGKADGRDIAPEERFLLLERILARLHDELASAASIAASGGTDWHSRLAARLYKKGETVCFVDGKADSDRVVEGRLEGIGPGGELLIAPPGGPARAFITGELRVY